VDCGNDRKHAVTPSLNGLVNFLTSTASQGTYGYGLASKSNRLILPWTKDP